MLKHKIKVTPEISYIFEHIFNYIQVIGDPHVYDARPGRRRDVSFLDTVLDKLSQAAEIANDNNAYTVITGDFFHSKTIDIKSEFINKIIKVLKKFKFKPLVLSGNHEKAEFMMTDKDALSILKYADLVDVIDGNELFGKIKIKSDEGFKSVALGGTCFGEKIPYDLSSFIGKDEIGQSFRDDEEYAIFKEEEERQKGNKIILISKTPKSYNVVDVHEKIKSILNVDKVVWLTHHDLAFNENYPYSRPLHPIDGVDTVINGHMHDYKSPVLKDLTQYYNPGNIVRLKIDEIHNIPSVWLYDPFSGKKEPDMNGFDVDLMIRKQLNFKHFEEVFSLEGKNIEASKKDLQFDNSEFVNLMLNQSHTEKTDEAVFIKEMLDEKKDEISNETYGYVMSLLKEVVEEGIKNK